MTKIPRLDPTGFPMVWIEVIQAYMHWLPVTKIQFEYFLCSVPDSQFDAKWYDDLLQRNPRVSPKNINPKTLPQAFLTAILPTEVQRFVRWLGDGYAIPTRTEWFESYKSLRGQSPLAISELTESPELMPRTKTLIQKIEMVSCGPQSRPNSQRDRVYQMLMRQGVMEWVECPDDRLKWGGFGEPVSGGLVTPDSGNPQFPHNPDGARLRDYGFRLIWREE